MPVSRVMPYERHCEQSEQGAEWGWPSDSEELPICLMVSCGVVFCVKFFDFYTKNNRKFRLILLNEAIAWRPWGHPAGQIGNCAKHRNLTKFDFPSWSEAEQSWKIKFGWKSLQGSGIVKFLLVSSDQREDLIFSATMPKAKNQSKISISNQFLP